MVKITSQGKQEIASLFKQKYPTFDNLHIDQLEEITTGWETNIFSFTLRYTENNTLYKKEYIIRMYYGAGQNSQAQKEFAIMQMVRGQEIQVPQVELLVVGNPTI
ncbi:MAG: hypothetical protein N2D54_03285, partial [Chloroflexota bacterium]